MFTKELNSRGAQTKWFVWPEEAPTAKGIDDLLAVLGPERVLEFMEHAAWPTTAVQQWSDPIPFQSVSPAAIPAELFPGFLGDMARACAKATETPIELAGLLGLAAVSAAIAGRVIVCGEPGYTEPLNVFVAPSMESGNRKTSVLMRMTRPIIEWEEAQAERIKPEQARLRSERKTLEARIENLRKQAAKSKAPPGAVREIAEMEKSLPEVPRIPKVWVQDITPEKLAVVMEENEERIAVLSDEGGIFDLLAGRYQ